MNCLVASDEIVPLCANARPAMFKGVALRRFCQTHRRIVHAVRRAFSVDTTAGWRFRTPHTRHTGRPAVVQVGSQSCGPRELLDNRAV